MAKLRSTPEPVDSYYDEAQAEIKKSPGLFDLAYLLPRLIARWHWILIGSLLGVVLGVITIRMSVPEYRSTATVRVKSQNSGSMGNSSDSDDIDLQSLEAAEDIRSDFDRTELFFAVASDPTVRNLANLIPPEAPSIMEVFTAKKAEEKKVFAEAPAPEQLAGIISGWTSSEVRRGTRLIDISVNHTDPDVAQVIANQIIQQFINIREGVNEEGKKSDLQHLLAAAKERESELETARRRAGSYTPALEAEKEMAVAEKAIQDLAIRYGLKHPKIISGTDHLHLKTKILLSAMRDVLSSDLETDYWRGFQDQIDDI
ncbi:Wzz/FepE/Etk N-terminal domain-containing protein, partial [Akkermansiaceae bacterium]|nr:Wzz/FepE/Etk N-terminal domain-containing protein [Akkermansiaceae bacterium]